MERIITNYQLRMEYKEEKRMCQNCKDDFTIESDDFSFYEKIKVPPPTFCALCRTERRSTFRNERRLFKVKNTATGKDMFSLYPERENKKNVTQEEWFGDNWDDLSYGVGYDFSRPFFEQFFELESRVPIYPLRVEFMINSRYCANASYLKNCYLCFNSNSSEDCMYGNATDSSKDCMDNSHISRSERCYECFWVQNCYQCYFTIMSVESSNLWFCRDCMGCDNCFGCTNLRKKSYCIWNVQYTKEEYELKIKEMKLNTISGINEARKLARDFWSTQLTKCHQGLKNLDSTGSYVTNCKNVKDSFLIREGENIRYSQFLQVPKTKDCYDTLAWGDNMELNYETCLCGHNSYNVKFSSDCWPNSKNLEYCISVFSSSDCFGCVGLKKKQYCIFNKQYSKEDYFILVEKIKKQMDETPYVDKKGRIYKYGEFFPIEFSPFGYNNSMAIQFFEMNKEKAEEKGYPWFEIPKGQYEITKKYSELPESISSSDILITKEIIQCQKCERPYRILEDEFSFYLKENLPLPIMCDECRFERRKEDRLKLQLYKRKCMCGGIKDETNVYTNNAKHLHGIGPCREEFETGYPLNDQTIVYCEGCYQQEVY